MKQMIIGLAFFSLLLGSCGGDAPTTEAEVSPEQVEAIKEVEAQNETLDETLDELETTTEELDELLEEL